MGNGIRIWSTHWPARGMMGVTRERGNTVAKHRDDTATPDMYVVSASGRYGLTYDWFIGDTTVVMPVAEFTADRIGRHAASA